MDKQIKAIIGLGNPGKQYYHTRHNIGFVVLDELVKGHQAYWQEKDNMTIASVCHNGQDVLLVKPLTFMNASGNVIPLLSKKGIERDSILVVHDELELPFGKLKLRHGGSAHGHNGLRSLIEFMSSDFDRLACGIGRPDDDQDIGEYVLSPFSERQADVDRMVEEAVQKIGLILDNKE